MGSNRDLVVAVDGGQSSTLALVATLDGQVQGWALAGPSNHIHEPGGMQRLENALRQSISGALHMAGRQVDDILRMCCGMTGAVEETLAFLRRWLPGAASEAYYDMVTALAGASLGQPGVIIIAGTGSIAYGRLADGREARSGGWGYLLGDEGSAFDIGLQAFRAAARADDGRGEPTQLLARILAHFAHLRVATLWDVRQAIYSGKISRSDIASLSAVAAAAAQDGDSAAHALFENAGAELAQSAIGVIRQLGGPEQLSAVYCTGGVFRAGSLVMTPLRAALQRFSARIDVRESAFAPVVGALVMALQASGLSLTPQIIETMRLSLPPQALSKHMHE